MWHEARRPGWLISTDPSLIDLDVVHGFLSAAYWCKGIPRETVKRGIENSIAFGVYAIGEAERADTQASGCRAAHGPEACPTEVRATVGFARVITDRATYAYLADVFVLEDRRGRGLSTWLMETVLAHPDLQGLRRFCLLTRDAHGLYAKYGFRPMADPSRYMEWWDPEVYTRGLSRPA
jgi:GNAT superfamily N-acetyltransferase